jgi:hypothetical protein
LNAWAVLPACGHRYPAGISSLADRDQGREHWRFSISVSGFRIDPPGFAGFRAARFLLAKQERKPYVALTSRGAGV